MAAFFLTSVTVPADAATAVCALPSRGGGSWGGGAGVCPPGCPACPMMSPVGERPKGGRPSLHRRQVLLVWHPAPLMACWPPARCCQRLGERRKSAAAAQALLERSPSIQGGAVRRWLRRSNPPRSVRRRSRDHPVPDGTRTPALAGSPPTPRRRGGGVWTARPAGRRQRDLRGPVRPAVGATAAFGWWRQRPRAASAVSGAAVAPVCGRALAARRARGYMCMHTSATAGMGAARTEAMGTDSMLAPGERRHPLLRLP